MYSFICYVFRKNALRRDKDFHADFSKQNIVIEERRIISVYPIHLARNWTLSDHVRYLLDNNSIVYFDEFNIDSISVTFRLYRSLRQQ